MLADTTPALQRGIGTRPHLEHGINGVDHVVQCWKVTIMQAATPGQLPDPLNRIEFRTVWRQEMQTKVFRDFFAPRRVERGVVIMRIVYDHHDLPSGTTMARQLPKEVPARHRVKHTIGSRHHELALLQPHRDEKADALSRRGVKTNRIIHFWRHPHAATRTMLLEVNFIHRPQIDFVLPGQGAEFFYAWLVIKDRLLPPADVVCATGSQTGGKAAGTAAPSMSRLSSDRGTQTRLGHPTSQSPRRR
jgi:hypothetical protein